MYMRESFYPNKNIIIADFDYQSALFLFKNRHPELDIKIISRNDLINKISYSFAKDPIPFLISKGIGYKKAKKYLDILLIAEADKNEELNKLFNDLNENGYLTKDEYGLYELSNSHVYLFEMEQDIAIQEFLKRNGLAYSFLDVAIDLIEDDGIINYYEFSDSYEQGIKRLNEAASSAGKKVEILNTRKVKSISPDEWHVAIDAKIKK